MAVGVVNAALDVMLAPEDCAPPHKVGYPDKVLALQGMFVRDGWSPEHPALVGYPLEGGIQLLSGSHRWAASIGVLERIPVAVVPFAVVEEAWGTDLWPTVMRAGDGYFNAARASERGTDGVEP